MQEAFCLIRVAKSSLVLAEIRFIVCYQEQLEALFCKCENSAEKKRELVAFHSRVRTLRRSLKSKLVPYKQITVPPSKKRENEWIGWGGHGI